MSQRREWQEVLMDAVQSPRLNAWERSFVESMIGRREDYALSEAQEAAMRRIENTIYATG